MKTTGVGSCRSRFPTGPDNSAELCPKPYMVGGTWLCVVCCVWAASSLSTIIGNSKSDTEIDVSLVLLLCCLTPILDLVVLRC